MAIPKIIYQTFSSPKLPLHVKFYIWRIKQKNRNYKYEFYDKEMREEFIKDNFPDTIYQLYLRLQIGAAQADFFRYAILYIKGGIYVDLDSTIKTSLDKKIDLSHRAIIAKEKTHKNLYAQWALIYEAKHPILKSTLNIILTNIDKNKYPHSVHQTTGPTPYSIAVHHYLKNNPNDTSIKQVDDNYSGIFIFKTIPSRIYELFNKKKHWRYIQQFKTVYKVVEENKTDYKK